MPKTLVTHGTAVNNTIRQIAGAIGTAVVITVFTTQSSSHAEALMKETPDSTPETVQSLAYMLGSGDAYYFMTLLAVISFFLVLFFPSKKNNPEQSSEAA